MSAKTVLVFGTFDEFHPGHEYFLKQAKQYGDRLVVSVARDAHVEHFKNKKAIHSQNERLHFIQSLGYVNEARLSDKELDSYLIVSRIEPNVIMLGHDQFDLKKSLKAWIAKNNADIKLIDAKKYVISAT